MYVFGGDVILYVCGGLGHTMAVCMYVRGGFGHVSQCMFVVD